MDRIAFATHLARIVDGGTSRVLAGLTLLALAVLGLAFVVGAVAADLLAPAPAEVFAAPFRWRV